MRKQAISVRRVIIGTVAIAALSLPLTSVAQAAQQKRARQALTETQCRIVGAISHRCYTFHSDATWPAGLSDYHGSNGG